MGIDDTNSHVQSLEQGATDARQRSGFAPQKRRLSLPAEAVCMLRELTRRGVRRLCRRLVGGSDERELICKRAKSRRD